MSTDIDFGSADVAIVVQGPVARRGGYWLESWRRLSKNRLGLGCGIFVLVVAILGIAAPLITHASPSTTDLSNTFGGSSAHHLLGTDELGRDVLARLLYGTRVSLGVAALTVLMSLTVGSAAGLIAAFYGGWVDGVLMRLVDILLAIPTIFLFILLGILFRPGVLTLAGIIAFVFWGPLARLVRSEALSIKERDYILAARLIGANDLRLLIKHMLPNVLPIIVISSTLVMAQVILAEAGLDFLGLGIHPPTASWGNMLANAQSYFFTAPMLVVYPGLAIFVVVLATTLFGNAVRDAVDPRLSRR
jgi:peptide/nickel transport system permease protein